eukprot:3296369-Amphidinium_carterae.1
MSDMHRCRHACCLYCDVGFELVLAVIAVVEGMALRKPHRCCGCARHLRTGRALSIVQVWIDHQPARPVRKSWCLFIITKCSAPLASDFSLRIMHAWEVWTTCMFGA